MTEALLPVGSSQTRIRAHRFQASLEGDAFLVTDEGKSEGQGLRHLPKLQSSLAAEFESASKCDHRAQAPSHKMCPVSPTGSGLGEHLLSHQADNAQRAVQTNAWDHDYTFLRMFLQFSFPARKPSECCRQLPGLPCVGALWSFLCHGSCLPLVYVIGRKLPPSTPLESVWQSLG